MVEMSGFMNLIKCENNHYYDSEKFLSCPHCANRVAEPDTIDILGTNQHRILTDPPDAHAESAITSEILGRTVGWLVCINGNMTGESFILREGDNTIGRAANMDISLPYEPTVSRDRHAIISYDSLRNSFVLHSPEHMEHVLCNNKNIQNRRTLKDHDVITLGDCSLLFVALCDAHFRWPEKEINA